jgi:hypothetical protein
MHLYVRNINPPNAKLKKLHLYRLVHKVHAIAKFLVPVLGKSRLGLRVDVPARQAT